jgi:hypothetical protein
MAIHDGQHALRKVFLGIIIMKSQCQPLKDTRSCCASSFLRAEVFSANWLHLVVYVSAAESLRSDQVLAVKGSSHTQSSRARGSQIGDRYSFLYSRQGSSQWRYWLAPLQKVMKIEHL